MTGHRRGQSVLVGIVLLFGLVAVSAAGIFLVASQSLDTIEQQAEYDRTESEFLELKRSLETNRYTTDASGAATLNPGENGVVSQDDTGWMNITEASGSGESINISLGEVRYDSTDGRTVAYQAGGVWRGTGSETQMLSAPSIHYDEESLSVPVTTVRSDEPLSAGSLTLAHSETTMRDEIEMVEDDAILIEITSEYYMGWASYFVSQTSDAVIADIDESSNTVVVELGRSDIDDGHLEKVATVEGDLEDGGGNTEIDGEYVAGDCEESDPDCMAYDLTHQVNSLDWQIQQMIDRAGSPIGYDPAGQTFDHGTYLIEDDIELENKDMTIDLQNGNVTLIVDGHLSMENQDINVINGEGPDSGTFRYYSSGSIAAGQDSEVNRGGNPSHTEIYGTSVMNVSLGQDAEISGSIYAPRESTTTGKNPPAVPLSSTPNCEDHDVCIGTGGATINGAIVVGSAKLSNGDNNLNYDPDVLDSDPTIEPEGITFPPRVTYLNVAEHEVAVENQ